uniref:Uncharacterized protein n=1 Tax=Arundo donax TaxID=35708 RepID=A0A0A8YWL1_ARUDO
MPSLLQISNLMLFVRKITLSLCAIVNPSNKRDILVRLADISHMGFCFLKKYTRDFLCHSDHSA